MFVTSQLPIQTTKFAIISFQRAVVPPHFEKGSATHGKAHISSFCLKVRSIARGTL